MRVAASSRRGINALKDSKPLASQPGISRLVRMLARGRNIALLRRFATTFAVAHLLQTGGGKRRDVVVIGIDGLVIDAHGRQQGSAFHGHCKRTIFMPLIASCAEGGAMFGAELRSGTQSVVRDCYEFVRRVALQVGRHVAHRVLVGCGH